MNIQQATERMANIAAQEGPGFFRLNDSKAKSYAFYWVDETGRILLISKIYRTARSRNKAQQQLASGNYQLEPVHYEGRFGYQILNGGNKAMSAGPLFATEAERDAAVRALPEKIRPESAEPAQPVTDQTQRHSFRLNFYRAEDQGVWKGKISYPLTERKKSFQGIDIDVIEHFLQTVLKENKTAAAEATEVEEKTKLAKEKSEALLPKQKKGKKRPEVSPVASEQTMTVFSAGKKVVGGALSVGTPVGIEVKLGPNESATNYRVQVFAKALPNGQSIPLDTQEVAPATKDTLHLPIHTDTLQAGLYRLNAEIMATAPQKGTKTHATSLIHLM